MYSRAENFKHMPLIIHLGVEILKPNHGVRHRWLSVTEKVWMG